MTAPTAAAGAVAAEQTLAASAQAFYALLAALSANAAQLAGTMWDGLDPADLVRSWNRLSLPDRLLVTTGVAQQAAATAASRYVGEAVAAQAGRSAGELLNPSALVGVASDGRDLDDLLASPLIRSLEALGKGATGEQAKTAGRSALTTIVGTQVADTGRAATTVAMTANPRVTGYVRMLTPPSCGRCAILAGRYYAVNAGFSRHPQCLPGGVVVSSPGTEAAVRRWYDGQLVVIRTASGDELPVTGNHPVLTDRGWVPAHLVGEGDHVVRSVSGHARPLAVEPVPGPDEDHVPALIEERWRSARGLRTRGGPSRAEDFHGDGCDGEVDVVAVDRLLRYGTLTESNEPVGKLAFPVMHEPVVGVSGGRVFALLGSTNKLSLIPGDAGESAAQVHTMLRGTASGSRGLRPRDPDFVGLTLTGEPHRCRRVTEFDTEAPESQLDRAARNSVLLAEFGGARARRVARDEFLVGQPALFPRWDAPAGPLTVESHAVYTARGRDLLERLSGQVHLDRVVESSRREWRGHVYNLTSNEGWFVANGLIVSNCDCVHIPSVEDTANDLTTDPDAYFHSLSAEDQNRYFGKGEAEAIRHGADIGQVVNARRGARGLSQPGRLTASEAAAVKGGRSARLQRVDVYGRSLAVTSEGTTKRGLAGQRLIAESGSEKANGSRYRRAKVPRLMPSAVIELAGGDRDLARELLYKHGYLLT